MLVGSRIIERERYYRAAKPDISKIYKADDALMLSVKNDHQGPWDETEQLTE
jgi:hypothetical protein